MVWLLLWTKWVNLCFSSVQFSGSFLSNSLQPHESQQASTPCPSPSPGVHSNSCSSSQWCHPTISSSVVPVSSCPQSLPASGSFPKTSFSHEVAKVLQFQLQHQSFQWTPRSGKTSTYFCFIDYDKAFDCVDHNKMWKILKVMGISDHLDLLPEKSLCGSTSNS